LAQAGPVDDESVEDSASSETSESPLEPSESSSEDDSEPLPSKETASEPEQDTAPPQNQESPSESASELTEDRFQTVIQLDGMALVLPSLEFGAGEGVVPTFTSGFMLNLGLGTRLWEGKDPSGVPMKTYMKSAEPMVEIVAGAHFAYEEGRDRLNEAYALSMGGYLGFFDVEGSDIGTGLERFFAAAEKGVMIGLSKRRSLDYEQVELVNVQRQWQLEATLSQSFEFLDIYQFSSLGFGNQDLPWRSTYGIGVGAAF
jgi:hypothetical protein